MIYGLLGKSLAHSVSPEIHKAFGNDCYKLYPTDNPGQFLKNKAFSGLNVTIPYKETVLPYLDQLDPIANRSHSVNTIVKKDNKLHGYNTDYDGLSMLVDHHKIDIRGKHILIVGNGGAANTVSCFLEDRKAQKVTKICRKPRNDSELTFSEIDKVKDCEIIINTTPVGMYPDNESDWLFDLGEFTNVTHAIDLIYNPLRTNFLLDAKTRGIKTINGLFMLVAQAARAHELFFETSVPMDRIQAVYSETLRQMTNIIFIGLPSSGKSLYARLLHDKYGLQIMDTDRIIEQMTGMTIPEIFDSQGEKHFRDQEFLLARTISKTHYQVISTGGGMVTNPALMRLFQHNGYIIFLDKDPAEILKYPVRNRPLIKKPEDLYRLASQRRPLYEKYADMIFKITKDAKLHFPEIERLINEHFDNQRAES